ncbi:MAG TPA: hypothetical protein VFO89_09460 [Thermoanaerobaculia bacterium]|nr:hypothetical protein [Thermoanaerobaculia bacterium]
MRPVISGVCTSVGVANVVAADSVEVRRAWVWRRLRALVAHDLLPVARRAGARHASDDRIAARRVDGLKAQREHGDMRDREMKRSEWVERYAAEFASIPFVREFVFPNPQQVKRDLQKEVCDLLIALRTRAIVVQIKAQERPEDRTGEKLAAWVRKKANEAVSQLSGSLRTLGTTDVWCDHSRRGRVEFRGGELHREHGIVLIECGAGTRVELPAELPLTVRDVPVAYLDASDFLNVVQQLRSFKEVESYFAARANLGEDVRRHIGDERIVLEHYLLNGGTFDGWPGYEDARHLAAADRAARDAVFQEKQRQRDIPAGFVEYVADTLAERLPNYAEGLDVATVQLFDADDQRQRYLFMQEVLADVSLVGRRQIGAGLLETFGPAGAEKPPCVYRTFYLDELPQFAFVAVSTSGVPRQEVVNRTFILLRAALAHFGWRDGMAIVDRDGASFDIVLLRGYTPTETDKAMGRDLFARLRIDDRRDRLV